MHSPTRPSKPILILLTALTVLAFSTQGFAQSLAPEFVYVTNRFDNNVSAYSINATSGALTPVAGSPFAAGSQPVGVAVDPSGHFVYVANLLSSNVSAYTLNATTGALTAVAGSPFAAGSAGSAPFVFVVAVDPSGHFVYVANESSVNVSAYSINATTGALTPVAGSPFAAGSQPAGLAVAVGVRDRPPVANAGPDQTVECASHSGTSVTLDGSASSNPDGDTLTFQWTDAGNNVIGNTAMVNVTAPLGTNAYTLKVTDPGGLSSTATTHVTVRDTTPPTLSVSLTPNVLWPPNHKLVPITATVTTSDACDPNPSVVLVSITSNEPDNGLGDGDTPNDIQGASFGTDDRSFFLRAERAGTGTGRIYTVTYRAMDASGNMSFATATVTVPHDQR